jgi:SAM-dependent methyltransferase
VTAAARTARAASFGGVADVYERARPDYPVDAVRWLAGKPPRRVLDLAAGTGKLTRALVAAGHDVVAVEPSEPMLERLRAVVPAAEAWNGTAESIPIAEASVDVVTVAQAFHWFDAAAALDEIARVLRPGGTVALVWNTRDEREPWVRRLSELIGSERLDEADLGAVFTERVPFGALERRLFRHEQRLSRAALLDLVSSRSYCATRSPQEREDVLDGVGALFDGVAVSGEVVLPYVTEAYRARRE